MDLGVARVEVGDDFRADTLHRFVGDVARMLSLLLSVRVFVSLEPFDMRGSFDAIRRLDLDPVNGHLYLFFNRRRRLAKGIA